VEHLNGHDVGCVAHEFGAVGVVKNIFLSHRVALVRPDFVKVASACHGDVSPGVKVAAAAACRCVPGEFDRGARAGG
jgi:hypothetical protein